MQKTIGYFSLSLEQFMGLLAVLFVCGCITVIGGAISARKRLHELDLIIGWSFVSFVFVLAGGWLRLDFRLITGALVVALFAAAFLQYKRPGPAASLDLGRTVILAFPMIWLAGCMTLSQWDDFTHWMPNAWYIFEYHTLPGDGNPPSPSGLPGYPHGLAYVVYLSSRIVGFLTENATPVFNIILLASLAILLGRLIKTVVGATASPTRPSASGPIAENVGWVYCAIGTLAVTALNPTFVPKIVFTSYADTATAVLVGCLCIILWLLLGRLAGDNDHSPRSLAWSYGLVAMAAVSVKQPNVVLFGLVTIGGLVVALRDPDISLVRMIRLLPGMILPPIAIYLAWRLHINVHEVTGEFQFLPRSGWLTDQISVVVGSMALVASKKGGYFAVMLIACLFAARALWRIRYPFDRLSLIVAVLFIGYNFFLLFVYVTAFGENGLVAPSYWRFNMHLGGACVAFGAYGLAVLWREWVADKLRRNYAWVLFALIIVAPVTLAYKIRFDQHTPKIFVRAVAEDIVREIPKGARFFAFDVTGIGEYEVIVRYVVKQHAQYSGFFIQRYNPTAENLKLYIERAQPEYAWVHVPTDVLDEVLGIKLPRQQSHLIQRIDNVWTLKKSWPFPGYTDPNTAPK